jgi:hypothetical protein
MTGGMTQENASDPTAPDTAMTEPPHVCPVLPPLVPTPKDLREMLERIRRRTT